MTTPAAAALAAIERMEAVEKAATKGPWFARYCDDEMFMNMTVVSKKDWGSRHSGLFGSEDDTIAITFHQCLPSVACNLDDGGDLGDGDTAFIVSSRAFVPGACEAIRVAVEALEGFGRMWGVSVTNEHDETPREFVDKTLAAMARALGETGEPR